MSQDRSLDEFVGGASESTEADAGADSDSAVNAGSDSAAEVDPDSNAEIDPDPESVDGAELNNAKPDDAGEPDREDVPGPDLDGVEPAAATYRWDPDGVECPECGEVVERLWTREGELVCADCKIW